MVDKRCITQVNVNGMKWSPGVTISSKTGGNYRSRPGVAVLPRAVSLEGGEVTVVDSIVIATMAGGSLKFQSISGEISVFTAGGPETLRADFVEDPSSHAVGPAATAVPSLVRFPRLMTAAGRTSLVDVIWAFYLDADGAICYSIYSPGSGEVTKPSWKGDTIVFKPANQGTNPITAVVHGPRIWFFYQSDNANGSVSARYWDGDDSTIGALPKEVDFVDWSPEQRWAFRTFGPIAAVSYRDRLYVAVRNRDDAKEISVLTYMPAYDDKGDPRGGMSWPQAASITAAGSPGLSVLNDILYLTYRGLDGSFYCKTCDGHGWSEEKRITAGVEDLSIPQILGLPQVNAMLLVYTDNE